MRRNVALESRITQAIMRRLRELHGVIVRKRHGSQMGVAGDPDLYGTIHGRHFEIEVKRPDAGSELTGLQAVRLEQWRRAGAIVGVARSVEEAMHLLLPLRRGVGQVAMAHARDLVRLGIIDREALLPVANAIATAITAYCTERR